MAKFPEADARMFKNVFVCRRCKTKRKAPVLSVLANKIACRNCGTMKLRVKRKK
jgi:ribosomal protein L40E